MYFNYFKLQLCIFSSRPLSPQQCLLGISMGLYNGFGLYDDMDQNRSISSSGSNHDIINQDIIHRKSCSMDSQIIAEHNRIASMLSSVPFSIIIYFVSISSIKNEKYFFLRF